VAYDVLRAVSESDAYANLLLPAAIADARLTPQDAALATELTYGTLRRLGTYDAVIEAAAGRATADIDPAVLDALRLAAHQLLATRVASHAAVNESVNLVSAEAGRGPAGFANAVLRRISRDTPGQWQERIEQGARSAEPSRPKGAPTSSKNSSKPTTSRPRSRSWHCPDSPSPESRDDPTLRRRSDRQEVTRRR
jgi:16S rRNA (cytosine967-C5)-methyltransferase